MGVLLVFAWLAGVVTVLSPCILPVLPIVLSSSVTGGKRRPYGVIAGFIGSFTFFTLFLSSIVSATGISPDTLRLLAVVVIGMMGVGLIWPRWQAVAEKVVGKLSSWLPVSRPNNQGGFGSGLLVGLSLGLIWTPCVGPILAAVISLAITGQVSGAAALITLAYALGTSLPMFAIATGGRELLRRVPWLLQKTAMIQRGFGVMMIGVAIAIALNWDRQFQTWILQVFPGFGTGLTALEDKPIVREQLDQLGSQNEGQERGKPMFSVQEEMYPLAPDFTAGGPWLNTTEPLSLAGNLQGKVVLVDFWTYSCINCIRTLPYLSKWHQTYAAQGFTVIGVHSPEFEFEKSADNVRQAVSDFGIPYPVVQDNEFSIWEAYKNRYWPAHYLIDKQGRVRYTHFGEGNYIETENKIRELLGESALPVTESDETTRPRRQTPETYLGYLRAESYLPGLDLKLDQPQTYQQLAKTTLNGVNLNGNWNVGPESITATAPGATLTLRFLAQEVYLVLSSPNPEARVRVLLDGQPVPAEYRPTDLDSNGKILINQARKYDLLNLGDAYGEHELQLIFDQGVSAYAFTFGS